MKIHWLLRGKHAELFGFLLDALFPRLVYGMCISVKHGLAVLIRPKVTQELDVYRLMDGSFVRTVGLAAVEGAYSLRVGRGLRQLPALHEPARRRVRDGGKAAGGMGG